MISIKQAPEPNGSYIWQSQNVEIPPEGFIPLPPQLEKVWLMYAPFAKPIYGENGNIIDVIDNPEAREAQEARAAETSAPTEAEQLRADVDYIAVMTGVELV